MTHKALIFLLIFLAASFVLLFVINIAGKLFRQRTEKLNRKNRITIKSAIDGFIGGTEDDYRYGLTEFSRDALKRSGRYLAMVDEYLLFVLEDLATPFAGAEDIRELPAALTLERYRERIIDIAAHLYFPAQCLAQIRSRNHQISALGARRAGLYNIKEAIKDMETALDLLSSENQFEIIMAFARMGESGAMRRAFGKIKNSILLNERGIVGILSAFPEGEEKKELFRRMLASDTDYIAALFLKALNRDMAKALKDEIIEIFQKENKDVRAAAVRGLACLGKDAPAKILIQALEDKDWEVRALAAKALGPVRTRDSSAALFNALYDRQWWVRQNAANALTGHPNYEALFMKAAEAGDEYARDSIVSALENGDSPVLLRSIKVMMVA